MQMQLGAYSCSAAACAVNHSTSRHLTKHLIKHTEVVANGATEG
jgi:hypothetical protein